MPIILDEFVQEFSERCKENNVSLFIGAGLSKDAGLPSWAELIEPLAKNLSIDITTTKYHMYDIAQFYANKNGKGELQKAIQNSLNSLNNTSDSLNEIANFQCSSIWTTNYDDLLESNFKNAGRKTNVIISEQNLITADLNKNVNIFKLNGDIKDLSTCIITKSDFEKYTEHHQIMLSFLKRELILKSFLFLGYSFTDSLILPCLAEISRLFNDETIRHYAILKDLKTQEFNRFVEDLEKRYILKILLIDDYKDLPKILNNINYVTNKRNVFISGSLHTNDQNKLYYANEICETISTQLFNEKFKIITGYGYKIGYYIACALTKLLIEESAATFEKYLLMYPFNEHSSEKTKTAHRNFMISKSNILIFLYGSNNEENNGVLEEFRIATKDKTKNKIIIPIASTGGTAKIIYDEICNNIVSYPYLEKYKDLLLKENNPKKIGEAILEIIKEATNS